MKAILWGFLQLFFERKKYLKSTFKSVKSEKISDNIVGAETADSLVWNIRKSEQKCRL
jgi:hypothetical protein